MLPGLWDSVELMSKILDCGMLIADFVYISVGLGIENLFIGFST